MVSLSSSIGSHATTIRNRMPVYDGNAEVLLQARPAPDLFARFANKVAAIVGTQWTFLAALLSVIIWLAMGPLGKWGTTWQLVINTGTTIFNFWIAILLQNTLNREAGMRKLTEDEQLRLLHEQLTILRTMLPEGHPARLVVEPVDFPAEV